MADDADLDGRDGDVEEAVLVVRGEAVELVRGGVRSDVDGLRLWDEGADDGLDEEGVEV